MRVYLSGAISNNPKYKKQFKKAEKKLRKFFDVINPAKVLDGLPKNTEYNVYMDLSLAMLEHCDLIFMLHNWEHSNGAKIELERAKELGIHIEYER